MEMMEKLMADDKTDVAVNHRFMCLAALPNAEVKAKVWAEITDVESTNSVYVQTAKIHGMYNSESDADLVTPYFDKFYEEVVRI